MLNETLVIKYFKEAYKDRIFIQNCDGHLILGTTNVFVKIPGNPYQFKLFNDRSAFPEMPKEIGSSMIYSKQPDSCNYTKGPNMQAVIDTVLSKDLKPVSFSPWLLKSTETHAHLTYCEKEPILINQTFLNLFDNETSWYGSDSKSPVLIATPALTLDGFYGLIMPMITDAVLNQTGLTLQDINLKS